MQGEECWLREVQGMGLVQFAEDVGLDPESNEMMVLLWKLDCKTQFQISRDEFVQGLRRLSVKNAGGIRRLVPSLKKDLNPKSGNFHDRFKSFYKFCFNYNKNPDARSLRTLVMTQQH